MNTDLAVVFLFLRVFCCCTNIWNVKLATKIILEKDSNKDAGYFPLFNFSTIMLLRKHSPLM